MRTVAVAEKRRAHEYPGQANDRYAHYEKGYDARVFTGIVSDIVVDVDVADVFGAEHMGVPMRPVERIV